MDSSAARLRPERSVRPNGGQEAVEQLETLSTWFRILTKKLLHHEEIAEYDRIRPDDDKGKDYFWYEMGFFTTWSSNEECIILCTGTPRDVRVKLAETLHNNPDIELADPFAMLRPLFDEITLCCDQNVWRATKQVRRIEKARGEEPSFETLNNLMRHTSHIVEVQNVAIETLERLASLQDSYATMLNTTLTKTYRRQSKEWLQFQVQMMKSMTLRAQASYGRLQGEISLAFNVLASTDTRVVRSITLLTMIFLPGTFVAAIFSTPFFDFKKGGLSFSTDFWLYWEITVPLTLIVVLCWWLWLGGSPKGIRDKFLHKNKAS